ncbi:hypothetical protein ACJKIH_02885 [Brucella pseudogrignonensis]|uniref:hypothetical protein n=1 Tax=Brucella pseudogrignonensis TaxID=419475 RepID=UPI0038B4EAF6
MEYVSLNLGNCKSGHDPDTGRLASAFFSDDDIGTLIRCHFEVERAAIHALDVITQERWKIAKYRYLNDKINFLEVIGAPPALLAPARVLNKHRNALAHSGIDTITEEQEHEFTTSVRSFFPQYSSDSNVSFHGKYTFDGKLSECSQRQRYVISASVLIMGLSNVPRIMAKYWDKANHRSGSNAGADTVSS